MLANLWWPTIFKIVDLRTKGHCSRVRVLLVCVSFVSKRLFLLDLISEELEFWVLESLETFLPTIVSLLVSVFILVEALHQVFGNLVRIGCLIVWMSVSTNSTLWSLRQRFSLRIVGVLFSFRKLFFPFAVNCLFRSYLVNFSALRCAEHFLSSIWSLLLLRFKRGRKRPYGFYVDWFIICFQVFLLLTLNDRVIDRL